MTQMTDNFKHNISNALEFDSAIRSDQDSWQDDVLPKVDPDADSDHDDTDAVDPDEDSWTWDTLESEEFENDCTADWFEDDEDLW